MKVKIAVLIMIGCFSSVGFSQSLTTLFASDNQFRGNTFDLVASSDITITGWDVNLTNAGATESVSIYYKLGTAVGFENNMAAWTMLGTDNNVVSTGQDAPAFVDVGGLDLDAGQVYGIYVDMASYTRGGDDGDGFDDGGNRGATSLRYTNGGPNVYANADLSLTTNSGQGSPPFGAIFFPRQWNGTIYYEPTFQIPTLTEYGMIAMVVLLMAAALFFLRKKRLATNA